MVRVVCAPDSFKESMTAVRAAEAMAEGVLRAAPEADCVLVPMADGGEGTARTVAAALGAQMVATDCHDALGRPIRAEYAWWPLGRTAVIESAAACGLEAIAPEDRDPMASSTVGLGELISDALARGARRFTIGLGGTATTDAGAGMCSALGVQFIGPTGDLLEPGGAALESLKRIDPSGLDPRIAESEFHLACDVANPLLGPGGASAVFGPQKGADPQQVLALDRALTNWANVVEAALGRRVRELPGAGAAGGLGAAFIAFTNATIQPGVEIVAKLTDLDSALANADWVFTGEGRVDGQTLHGKTPAGVARHAAARGVRVLVFAGSVGEGAAELLDHGVTAIVPIMRRVETLPEALAHGPANLADASELATRLLQSNWAASGQRRM